MRSSQPPRPCTAVGLGPVLVFDQVPGRQVGWLWCHLKTQDHRCAPSRGVVEDEVPSHGLDEAFGDGEAEPDTATGAAVAEALEGQENAVTVGRGNSGSAVDDAELDPVPGRTASHDANWGGERGGGERVGK